MTELISMGEKAREAALSLMNVSTEEKNKGLQAAAAALRQHAAEIVRENARDLQHAKEKDMPLSLQDRLLLDEARIEAMAQAMEKIVTLPDPVGELVERIERPNGLRIEKKRVPIGVIGIIYEARPNVTSDAFSLCLKSGNAVILKGGSDAIHSNLAITKALRAGLSAAGMNPDILQLIEDTSHETTREFMQLNAYVDVLIPRGSHRLIQAVLKNATVPVIETGAGNCHIFLDQTADVAKAVPIAVNAKTQRTGVCNACESLVVDRQVLDSVLLPVAEALIEKKVTIYADPESFSVLSESPTLDKNYLKAAEEADFGTEYLDLKISVKTVGSVEEAIRHINHYSTKHSESIITEDHAHAEAFLNGIDSACVYWNASTRFTDGGEFGFGAEIGISTAKLHARGPMGLRELTTTKYTIYGNGQVR